MKPTLSALWILTRCSLCSALFVIPASIAGLELFGRGAPESRSLAMLASTLGLGFCAWWIGTNRFNTYLRGLCGPVGPLRQYGPWVMLAGLGLASAGGAISVLLHRHIPGFGALPKLEFAGWAGFITVALAAPFCEELLFRGVILRRLLEDHRPTAAIAIGAALFAACHVYPVRLLHTFVLGLLWSWLYCQTKSIWPGVAGHAALNALCVLAPSSQSFADFPVAPALMLGAATAALGLYGLIGVKRIAEAASYSTPTAPPRMAITVE